MPSVQVALSSQAVVPSNGASVALTAAASTASNRRVQGASMRMALLERRELRCGAGGEQARHKAGATHIFCPRLFIDRADWSSPTAPCLRETYHTLL